MSRRVRRPSGNVVRKLRRGVKASAEGAYLRIDPSPGSPSGLMLFPGTRFWGAFKSLYFIQNIQNVCWTLDRQDR